MQALSRKKRYRLDCFFYKFEKIYPVKVQDLLAPYLYQHKKLTLPGIGTLELDPSVNVYELKDEALPAGSITFTADRNAVADDLFLTFLVENSGKMKILAQSDLDSFINNGLQLLNIGKPFQLNGIGLISRGSFGGFTFEQGTPSNHTGEAAGTHYVLKDRTREKPVEHQLDFSSEEKKSSRKPFIWLAGIVALGLIAWAVYLAIPPKNNPTELNDTEQANTDTVAVLPPVDTSTAATVTTDSSTTAPITDTTHFRLLVRQFSVLTAAEKKAEQMKTSGHQVEVISKDSATHLIILRVNKPLRDTGYVIDSLRKWYQWKATLYQEQN